MPLSYSTPKSKITRSISTCVTGWKINSTARNESAYRRPILLAFIRIGTNPKAFNRPLSVRGAWAQVKEWLAIPTVWIPLPIDRHAAIWGELLHDTAALANLVPDAHLAALAIEHGLILQSTDGDLARFPRLQWQNPLRKKNPD